MTIQKRCRKFSLELANSKCTLRKQYEAKQRGISIDKWKETANIYQLSHDIDSAHTRTQVLGLSIAIACVARCAFAIFFLQHIENIFKKKSYIACRLPLCVPICRALVPAPGVVGEQKIGINKLQINWGVLAIILKFMFIYNYSLFARARWHTQTGKQTNSQANTNTGAHMSTQLPRPHPNQYVLPRDVVV